tara:strand:+ start:3052 stop:3195 length:144 start_codon:yes stop_codon:yes gene_type:complete
MKKLEVDYKGETLWLDYNEWLFLEYVKYKWRHPKVKEGFNEWKRARE